MAGPGGREVARISVRVVPDTADLARGGELERDLRRLERSLRIEIPTVADSSGITKDIQRIASRAERSGKIDLPAGLDERGLNARVTALVRRLSGKEITIGVDIDAGLARARSGIAMFGRSMSALALPASIISAVPTLLGVGAAAITAAGAVNLLPGVLGAAAFGFAALKIGMSGFGDALKNMGDPEKFAESLKGLAPAARETAIAIQGLKPRFDELRTSVQDRLFDGMAAQISALGTVYLPILDERFGRIADAANEAAKSITLMLTESSRVDDIKTIGNKAAVAFENLFAALGPISAALVDIGVVGATFLPGLTQGARNAATEFQRFIANARETGQLADWIRNAGAVFHQLGQIVSNVGSLLAGLFNAAGASGAGALASIERLTAGLSAFVHSAQGSTALSQIFAGIGAAMAGIVPAVTQVVAALTVALGPVLAELGPAIGQLALQLGSALVVAIQAVTPLLVAMAGFLRENMTWLGPVAIGFGALVAALSAIGPVIGFVMNLATAFKLAGLAFRVLSTALLTNPFVALAAAVIAIGFLIYNNWDAIKSFLIATWQWIASTATSIWNGIASFFSGLWSRITGFFSSAASGMTSIMSGAWAGLRGIVSSGVSNVVGFVASLPGRILGALGNLGRLLWSAGADLVRGMINGVRSMIGNLLGTVRNMAQQAVAGVKSWLGIGSPSKVFRQLGLWTGEGFAQGIERGAPQAVRAAGDMARSVAATPVASPVAPSFAGGGGQAGIQAAVTAGVLAGLHGSRMRVDGDGVARLVNKSNAVNARR